MKAEFVQLAKPSSSENLYDWFISEKLDGMRALWDGGVSRGLRATGVPFANTKKDKKEVIATGLWSRYGKVIYAPNWWLDQLPVGMMLDGELWTHRDDFQGIVSIVKKHEASQDWSRVTYRVFDSPSYHMFCQARYAYGPNYEIMIPSTCYGWAVERGKALNVDLKVTPRFFDDVVEELRSLENKVIKPLEQSRRIDINDRLEQVTSQKGEGLIARRPMSIWTPERNDNLIKIKPFLEGSGTVVGYVGGNGKLFGLIGSVIVAWQGNTFKLSGFTDEERGGVDCSQFADKAIPENLESPKFPRGSKIDFLYRSLSKDGVPKEARFHRSNS